MIGSTPQSPHILIVEDDQEISKLVARYLRANDYRVSVSIDGRQMNAALETSRIDLIVLDLMLPGEDGLSLCRRLRAKSSVPIVMLTAKGEEIDRIVGLEIGADDYLSKPFNLRELLARIRAVLRRAAVDDRPSVRARALTFQGWRLDGALRELRDPKGARVAVTDAEYDLLQALCERAGRVLSRDQLLDLTQGRAAAPFERSVDVLVSRLRRKIESDPQHPTIIKTVRSDGYLFAPTVEWLTWTLSALLPRRISSQIAALILVSLLAIHALVTATFILLRPVEPSDPPGAVIDRLETIARLVDAAPPDARAGLLMTLDDAYPQMSVSLSRSSPERTREPRDPKLESLRRRLGSGFAVALDDAEPRGDRPGRELVAVRLQDGAILTARMPLLPPPPVGGPFMITLGSIAICIGLLGWWAARSLTLPLRTLARAAENLSPDS